MINTIIFDLDGTLLPINQDEFVNEYFKLLVQKIAPIGYSKDEIIGGIFKGTQAMQNNDGSAYNNEQFWKAFISALGEKAAVLQDTIDEFYANEFHGAKICAKSTPNRRELINRLRDKGYTLVLASNPLFPHVAMNSRLSWVGLSCDDFDYVTHYANSKFCKPSLSYYENILSEIGKNASECLMVGNNPVEDGCVNNLGVDVFIVTDVIEGDADNIPYSNGTFEEAEKYILSL